MPLVTMPSWPEPQILRFTRNDIVSVNDTMGDVTTADWNAGWYECQMSMPAMPLAQAQAWIAFCLELEGQAGVFQYTYKTPAGCTGYWSLKANSVRWRINEERVWEFEFDVREAMQPPPP